MTIAGWTRSSEPASRDDARSGVGTRGVRGDGQAEDWRRAGDRRGGALSGIFTGRDLVRIVAAGHDPDKTQLCSAMTRDPQTMPPGRHAIDALREMHDGGFRHIPWWTRARLLASCRAATSAVWSTTGWTRTGYWERIG